MNGSVPSVWRSEIVRYPRELAILRFIIARTKPKVILDILPSRCFLVSRLRSEHLIAISSGSLLGHKRIVLPWNREIVTNASFFLVFDPAFEPLYLMKPLLL